MDAAQIGVFIVLQGSVARQIDKYRSQLQRYPEHLRYSSAEEYPENVLIKTEEMDKILSVIKRRLHTGYWTHPFNCLTIARTK